MSTSIIDTALARGSVRQLIVLGIDTPTPLLKLTWYKQGKIFCEHNDYLIARSVSLRIEIAKKFYFSNDGGRSFAFLPHVDAWAAEKAEKYHGHFTGDPSSLLNEFKPPKQALGEPGEQEEGDEDTDQADTPRRLSELERLAWTVSTIDFQTHVVPKGAFIRNAANDLIPNPGFSGFGSPSQLKDLTNYQHLRAPSNVDNLLSMAKRVGAFSTEAALDPTEADLPRGAWTTTPADSCGLSVHLRNHIWPGFSARICTGSKEFAESAYFGHGQRNQDLIFAL